jgi:iron complex transport system substrate-binding protein
LLAPVLRDKPLLGRLSGRGSTVSLETLLALGPDLIVDAGSVGETQVSSARRVAAQTGLPCVLVDGRLADSPAQLRQLGALLGVPARGERLAAHAEQVLAAAQSAAQQLVATRPTVYLARGADGLETATAGAINAEIIEAAGGRNVADTGRPGLARVSLEQVLAWNPDWVLTQDRHFQRLARQDPGWRSLAAVREGRLLLAPALPFGWLDGPPSVNRLLGIPWLASHLRLARPALPGTALQQQVVDDARRFHALFYGPTPAREAVQGWLDGSA